MPSEITLRTPTVDYKIPDELVNSFSARWSAAVRNRRWWAGSDKAEKYLQDQALEEMSQFGIGTDTLKQLAQAGVIEVSVPYLGEGIGWAGRILPWESLLSAVTSPYRSTGLAVIRHLDIQLQPVPPPAQTAPNKLVFAQSSPGEIDKHYTFDSERKLVEASLGFPDDSDHRRPLINPTFDQLKAEVEDFEPGVIHLAGVDVHQAVDLLGWALDREERRWDGYILSDETGAPTPVSAQRLAEALCPAVPKAGPALVGCNLYNSAARIAAMAVARGAGAAIGFEDEIDDFVSERFFGDFYTAWQLSGWNLLEAFRKVLANLSASGEIHAAGVVLWSARPLLQKTGTQPQPPAKRAELKPETILPDNTGTGDGGVGQWFEVQVEPNECFNYSDMHNKGGLFKKFNIRKFKPARADGISVEVQLYLDQGMFPFRTTLPMEAEQTMLNVAEHVNIPLVSRAARSGTESLYTSMYVEVKYQGAELYSNTHRVQIVPVNEWNLEKIDLLASFVLPRDPVIRQIIDAAQRYLTALQDDGAAGFDGYQATDDEADDPDEGVDMQARAIWAALSIDYGLKYINPPPSYTLSSQRLRTPSEVIGGRRGTCVDLALLFASCLEYIGIFPVIFVLEDHAFPGYWRSEESYKRLIDPGTSTQVSPADALQSAVTPSKPSFATVAGYVRDGDLVAIETVWLTRNKGFWESTEAGAENLRDQKSFTELLDICNARDRGVLPLPVVEDRG